MDTDKEAISKKEEKDKAKKVYYVSFYKTETNSMIAEAVELKHGISVFLCLVEGKFSFTEKIPGIDCIYKPRRNTPYKPYKISEALQKSLEENGYSINKLTFYSEIKEEFDTFLDKDDKYK